MIGDAIKPCPPTFCDSGVGYFAIDSPILRWERCRENFAGIFTADKQGLFFVCRDSSPGADVDVASFLIKTEEIIGLPEYSTFLRTDNLRVIWVEPSSFWMTCAMRRQVFTIFLRAGINYLADKDNYEDALWSEERARESKRAIMRFLFGYVRYIPNQEEKTGWVATFEGKDDDAIRKCLVLPSGCKEEYCIIGAGKLWHS